MELDKKTFIPFDQYQRYETISKVINYYRGQEDSKVFQILELGASEHKDMKLFLPNDEILFTDIALTESMKNDPDFQQADGTSLPFENKSFDFVIAADVLEHIQVKDRKMFLAEACRVAQRCAILSFPIKSEDVIDAEARVNSYFKALSGQEYIWLYEHRKNGLPVSEDIVNILDGLGYYFFSFSHGDLRTWERMWYCHFDTVFAPETLEYRESVDHYYNCNLYNGDISENCYRTFYIVSCEEQRKLKQYISALWKPTAQEKEKYLSTLLEAHNHMHPLFVQNKLLEKLTVKIKSIRRFGEIYFDCGRDSCEKNTVQIHIDDDNRIKQRINLPEGCHAVRLDPVEGCGCLLWNLRVRCESQFLEVSDHNGIALNDVYIFRTVDPQIYFDSLPVGGRWLEVEAEVICLEQMGWVKLVQEVERVVQDNEELLVENERKNAECTSFLQHAEELNEAYQAEASQRKAAEKCAEELEKAYRTETAQRETAEGRAKELNEAYQKEAKKFKEADKLLSELRTGLSGCILKILGK